jgi:hypothetical protein
MKAKYVNFVLPVLSRLTEANRRDRHSDRSRPVDAEEARVNSSLHLWQVGFQGGRVSAYTVGHAAKPAQVLVGFQTSDNPKVLDEKMSFHRFTQSAFQHDIYWLLGSASGCSMTHAKYFMIEWADGHISFNGHQRMQRVEMLARIR